MKTEKDYIGPDPVRWVERLRDVNQSSQFRQEDKDSIEKLLYELQTLLE